MSPENTPTVGHRARLAGVTIPLFSLRSRAGWGIGELGDLPSFAAWIKEEGGIGLVQLLPLGEISGGETSPYAALTAFGLDPMYLSLDALPELRGRVAEALGDEGLATLERARSAERVDYEAVRALKSHALRYAFRRFVADDVARGTERAHAMLAFAAAERGWLEDYALYRAIKDAHEGRAWWDWAPRLAAREPTALAAARTELGLDVMYYTYAQWLCHTQFEQARAAVRALGVELMGDLPFMVGRDSVDVWVHDTQFKRDASVGAPPDAFSEEGQDWDLPPYNWEAMEADGFTWLRRRAGYMARLYDRFRIDHLVGFYRTFERPRAGKRGEDGKLVEGAFDPKTEAEQLPHGERVIGAMIEAAAEGGATLIAEDLGMVPAFVRASIAKLGVPGYKVLIWEKDDAVYRDPKDYPELSVACFGTHDTPPVASFWTGLGEAERAAFLKLPALAAKAKKLGGAFDDRVQTALFELLSGSASDLVLFLMQDISGSSERINTPGTTGAGNWSVRLPTDVDGLRRDAKLQGKLARVRAILAATGRAR